LFLIEKNTAKKIKEKRSKKILSILLYKRPRQLCQYMPLSIENTSGYAAIDWHAIIDHNYGTFTPESVRAYLSGVNEKMNKYFAVIMFGQSFGQIRVAHYSRTGSVPNFVTISMSKARSLFSKCVCVRWVENGKRKKIFKKVIDFWIDSSNRKELYFQPNAFTQIKSQPVKRFIELLMTSESSLILPGLNTRTSVYELFENAVTTPTDWNPKSISQELYRVIPCSRPSTGKRVRKKGIAMIFLPSKEILCTILQSLNDNTRILF